jgi:hypothetical protein
MDELERSAVCSLCSKTLLVDEDVRYIVDIRVYAAADPIEISPWDLSRDHKAEMLKIIRAARKYSGRELEEQVYKDFRFYLCPGCQKKYIAEPLPAYGAAEDESDAKASFEDDENDANKEKRANDV